MLAPAAAGMVLMGRYRVERVLGTGGMGQVVAATDQESQKQVAIKLMLPKGDDESAGAAMRFLREARAAKRLHSEHVVQVLDVGTLPDGTHYIVMERLQGCDLRAQLKRHGAMPVDAAVDLILQAADAISEAHGIGVVHRDLKPANLFLTRRRDGSPFLKVLDFGISKIMPSGESLSTSDLGLTGTMTVLGSPMYMSPEQMTSAKTVDERTDIWALGVNLYQFVSGKIPFEADGL